MMTHLMTRTKLARLIPFTHFLKCSLKERTTIPCSLHQFSTKTSADYHGKPSSERCRVELPKELSKHVIVLSCDSTSEGGVCDVYVVGTVHISKESSKQVEDIIKFLKPETVFLELCPSRIGVLFREKIKVPTVEDMIAMWKKKHNILGILYSWFMAELANELDVYLGAEFRSGFREARKYGGRVVLGDRPIQITLKRTWRKLPLKHILRLFNSYSYSYPDCMSSFSASLSFSDNVKILLKKLDDDDNFRALTRQIMSEKLPTVFETIVHERDQYMCHTLLKVASQSISVVVVVGRGHLEGIKKNWEQPIKFQDLLIVPPPKLAISVMKIFAYGIVVAGVTIITNTYL